MGNSHNKKISIDQLDDILPQEIIKKQNILSNFTFEEIQLIHQLYESLRLRSKAQTGIDRDVFVKFCPIPGFWGHRLYKFMRNIDSPQSDNITFKNFIQTLYQLCRQSRAEQDKNIFKIFDIRDNEEISKEEITMMIVNLPDMGFTLSQNVLIPDIQYKHIKDEVLNSIVKQRNIYNYMKFYQNTQIKQLNNVQNQKNVIDAVNLHFQSQAILQKQTGYTNIVTSNPQFNNDVQSVNNLNPINISQSVLERTLTEATNIQATQQFINLNAKQLYIEMRNQLVELTQDFIEKNIANKQNPQMDFDLFVKWMDIFPFIRMQIKESMMPRVWSLRTSDEYPKNLLPFQILNKNLVPVEECKSPQKDLIMQDQNTENKQNQMLLLSNIKQQQDREDQNKIEKQEEKEQGKNEDNNSNIDKKDVEVQNPLEPQKKNEQQSTPLDKNKLQLEQKQEETQRSKSVVSCSPALFFNFKDKNKKQDQFYDGKKLTERIIPPSSIILKEGDLYKIGRSTSIMQPRYYVLRDSTLFVYKDKNDKIPQNLIILRGTYINLLKTSKNESHYGFSIKSEYKSFKSITLYHQYQEAILDWVRLLKQQASNMNFEDKYTKGRKLGSGKFSTVYQCQNRETQEIVAVKQINKSTLSDREKEFLREEIQIVRLISHPNVVQMKESYETDKYLYIVMEQVNGGELFEHIRTYDLDEKEVALIMNQLIEAISYMQMCGVVHRDLKPENILVEKDPRSDIVTVLKVADFGLSKITVPDEIMMESCGTPAYVAPEVLLKKGYKKEIDMWSAGIIFYTLVCRQLPFQSQDRKTTFYNIRERAPDLDNNQFYKFSRETKDLIQKMLIKNPDQRITPQAALKHRFFVLNGLGPEQKKKKQQNNEQMYLNAQQINLLIQQKSFLNQKDQNLINKQVPKQKQENSVSPQNNSEISQQALQLKRIQIINSKSDTTSQKNQIQQTNQQKKQIQIQLPDKDVSSINKSPVQQTEDKIQVQQVLVKNQSKYIDSKRNNQSVQKQSSSSLDSDSSSEESEKFNLSLNQKYTNLNQQNMHKQKLSQFGSVQKKNEEQNSFVLDNKHATNISKNLVQHGSYLEEMAMKAQINKNTENQNTQIIKSLHGDYLDKIASQKKDQINLNQIQINFQIDDKIQSSKQSPQNHNQINQNMIPQIKFSLKQELQIPMSDMSKTGSHFKFNSNQGGLKALSIIESQLEQTQVALSSNRNPEYKETGNFGGRIPMQLQRRQMQNQNLQRQQQHLQSTMIGQSIVIDTQQQQSSPNQNINRPNIQNLIALQNTNQLNKGFQKYYQIISPQKNQTSKSNSQYIIHEIQNTNKFEGIQKRQNQSLFQDKTQQLDQNVGIQKTLKKESNKNLDQLPQKTQISTRQISPNEMAEGGNQSSVQILSQNNLKGQNLKIHLIHKKYHDNINKNTFKFNCQELGLAKMISNGQVLSFNKQQDGDNDQLIENENQEELDESFEPVFIKSAR